MATARAAGAAVRSCRTTGTGWAVATARAAGAAVRSCRTTGTGWAVATARAEPMVTVAPLVAVPRISTNSRASAPLPEMPVSP